MNTFAYGIFLQWKLDIRNKGMILTYYLVPLVFFGFMGGIFASINPLAKDTLIQTMTVFAVSMGAFLGTPIPLVDLLRSDIKKAYKVGGIPLSVVILNNLISGFIHLFIVSLIIFFLAPLVFKAKIPNNLMLYFTSLAMFIFICSLLGSILGLFVKSTSKLAMVSQVLFLPSIMLSGIMFPSNMLPKVFEYVGKALPASWGYINMSKNNFSQLTLIQFILMTFGAIVILAFKIKHLEEINE